ncbi:MAG: glycoside hydrolase family 3 C-terminal domain-containing protein [Clostridia bacterium]|nr:glycoside hydrolase family 3 C-terminal domain-containing protein [Clostridia bacterium]
MMNIPAIISAMAPQEKADLCSGADFWHTVALVHLGVPSVTMADGPHGLRKQTGGMDSQSEEATCFPTAAGAAASFDEELLYEMGCLLGDECRAQGVSVLLGPGVNIKRSPLCGRNFEYFSEDPYLSGQMGAAFTRGLQSRGVSVCLKHFAVNNQETRRMTVSARVSERTLREIYLASFEQVVKQARPWSVMSSYNRVNGEYVHASRRFLTDILRDEWGFDGAVITDWGACYQRVPALQAGGDLEMPGGSVYNTNNILEALSNGTLEPEVLDRAVERILRLAERVTQDNTAPEFDRKAHHEAARRIARQTMVLLKNEGILPLPKDKKVALIGPFVKSPRYQGAGSSHVHTEHVVSVWEASHAYGEPVFAQGVAADAVTADEHLLLEAVEAARSCGRAVLFMGLPDSLDAEGSDREGIDLPAAQNALIEAVAAVGVPTAVVLVNGSAVSMPWIDRVGAVLECFLAGEAVGEAQADLLFGAYSPCAKLSETFPLRLQDTPAYGNFPGHGDEVDYGEGVYVGYRHYQKRGIPTLFPFGHGLSYTHFTYSDLALEQDKIGEGDFLTLTFTVKNTGAVHGAEIAQVYVAPRNTAHRPEMELRQFAKAELAPGESQTIRLTLSERAFRWYKEGEGWLADAGVYDVRVGASSSDIRLAAPVTLEKQGFLKNVGMNTTLGDLLADGRIRPYVQGMLASLPSLAVGDVFSQEQFIAMIGGMPLRSALMFSQEFTPEALLKMIEDLNTALENGTHGTV